MPKCNFIRMLHLLCLLDCQGTHFKTNKTQPLFSNKIRNTQRLTNFKIRIENSSNVLTLSWVTVTQNQSFCNQYEMDYGGIQMFSSPLIPLRNWGLVIAIFCHTRPSAFLFFVFRFPFFAEPPCKILETLVMFDFLYFLRFWVKSCKVESFRLDDNSLKRLIILAAKSARAPYYYESKTVFRDFQCREKSWTLIETHVLRHKSQSVTRKPKGPRIHATFKATHQQVRQIYQ